MIRPYFKDPMLEQTFLENGYVVIPFLESDELDKLKGLYEDCIPKDTTGLYASSLFNPPEVNRKVNAAIRDIMKDAVERYCEAGMLLGGSFLVKSPVNTYDLPLHQDWNIIDEQKYPLAVLWCPLQDTNEQNGTLYVLPKSHRFFVNYRSGAMPSKRVLVTEALKSCLKTIDVRAGEALVYHPALFHGSHPNLSDKMRVVVGGSTIHADSTLVYYHLNKDNGAIEVYRAVGDFYLNEISLLEVGEIPDNLELLDTFWVENIYPDADDLMEQIDPSYQRPKAVNLVASDNTETVGGRLWRKVRSLFGNNQ